VIRIPAFAVALTILATPAVQAKSHDAASPATITSCETISQPGDYILASDIALTVDNPSTGGGGDCLVITASHVNIDMQDYSIGISCPFSCSPQEYGPVGTAGVHIMSGANNVSIANGEVDNFMYGVLVEADHASVDDFISFNAIVALSLDNVSNSTFTDISFGAGGLPYNFSVGPMVSVAGGGHNTFTELTDTVSDSGVEVMNSSHNVVSQADISCSAVGEAGPGILLTGDSGHNLISDNNVDVLDGNGIEVDLGSDHNAIQGNTVSITSPAGDFAMYDKNPNCGHDLWIGNSFTNASPASCIH